MKIFSSLYTISQFQLLVKSLHPKPLKLFFCEPTHYNLTGKKTINDNLGNMNFVFNMPRKMYFFTPVCKPFNVILQSWINKFSFINFLQKFLIPFCSFAHDCDTLNYIEALIVPQYFESIIRYIQYLKFRKHLLHFKYSRSRRDGNYRKTQWMFTFSLPKSIRFKYAISWLGFAIFVDCCNLLDSINCKYHCISLWFKKLYIENVHRKITHLFDLKYRLLHYYYSSEWSHFESWMLFTKKTFLCLLQ